MSYFHIKFETTTDLDRVRTRLADRLGLKDRPIECHEFPWGRALIQPPCDPRHLPTRTADDLYVVLGRPVFPDGVALSAVPGSFTARLARPGVMTPATTLSSPPDSVIRSAACMS